MAIAAPLIPLLFSVATSVVGGVISKKNADAEANLRRKIGRVEKEDSQRSARRLLAAQEAQFAANNVAIDTGTPLDVAGDTFAELELIALRLKFARDAESDTIKRAGEAQLLSGIFEATGTVLGGALDAKKAGLFG